MDLRHRVMVASRDAAAIRDHAMKSASLPARWASILRILQSCSLAVLQYGDFSREGLRDNAPVLTEAESSSAQHGMHV